MGLDMELKKATSFDEQIELLKAKRIIIEDEDACRSFLQEVNYYRLAGYYLPYMDRKKNQCFRDTSFRRIMGVYAFDAELRMLLFSTIETIEIFLRAQIANYHSLKYGPEGYCYASSFNTQYDHAEFLKRIRQCKQENNKSHIVMHHNQKYGGHFPLWVIIEYFSIGMLSYFYRGMHNQDKTILAYSLYHTNFQTLDSWLRCLTDLRNCCAHYSRLYYRKFSALPAIPSNFNYQPTRRVFAQLCMLKFMYPDSMRWRTAFVDPLRELIHKYEDCIILTHLDFPINWETLLA